MKRLWLAAALLLALVFSLVVYLNRMPPVEEHRSIHDVDYDKLRAVEMVNINEDSVEKLSRLPGVGEVLAQRIIAYREEQGPFTSIEEIMKVSGIGESRFESLKGLITVGDVAPTEPQVEEDRSAGFPVNINTADLKTLMTLPGIGETYAQRIIDYREEKGAFASIEEIMEVSGIGESRFEEIKDYITVEDTE